MSNISEQIIEWHNDGHSISILLNKSNFVIDSVNCPGDKTSQCYSDVLDDCFVRWFLFRYGFDCNVGVVPAQAVMEIAWTRVAESLHDPEQWQVWIIPISDEIFAAWVMTQNGDDSGSTS
jgi:hypothetical protein